MRKSTEKDEEIKKSITETMKTDTDMGTPAVLSGGEFKSSIKEVDLDYDDEPQQAKKKKTVKIATEKTKVSKKKTKIKVKKKKSDIDSFDGECSIESKES